MFYRGIHPHKTLCNLQIYDSHRAFSLNLPFSTQEVVSFWWFFPSHAGALCPKWWVLCLRENGWEVLIYRRECQNLALCLPFLSPFVIFHFSLPLPFGCFPVTFKSLGFTPEYCSFSILAFHLWNSAFPYICQSHLSVTPRISRLICQFWSVSLGTAIHVPRPPLKQTNKKHILTTPTTHEKAVLHSL